MKLAVLQATFFEWVTGPDDIPSAETAAVVGGGALSPATRVGIYAEMYWLRARDVLRGDFPLTRAALGDDAFDAAASSYLQAHPSRHPSLAHLGHAFSTHLERHGWVADLARVEWLRGQAFIARDAPTASMHDVSAVGPERLPTARLHFVPSVAIETLHFDVCPRFEGESEPAVARTLSLLVWRRDFTVFHAEVNDAEAHALRLAMAGHTVAEVCECFGDANAAFAAIGSWVNEGLVAAIDAGD